MTNHRIASYLLVTGLACLLARPAPAQKPGAERRLRLIPAFVIDDRLAALRREAALQSEVTRRLRLARPVYLIESKPGRRGEPAFHRVAISRRTRGWLHEAAIAVPGRAGDDARVVRRMETVTASFDRLVLCRLFLDHFGRSRLRPRVLMAMAVAAERAAAELNRTAGRRLRSLTDEAGGARARDYFLTDTGLDRYTRLRLRFDYSEKAGQYIYDGQAYREILQRFPDSDEAGHARERWEATRRKLAQK